MRNVCVFAGKEVNFSKNGLYLLLFFAPLPGNLTLSLEKNPPLPRIRPKPASRSEKSVCMDNITDKQGGKTARRSYDKVTEKRLHLRGKSVVFVA